MIKLLNTLSISAAIILSACTSDPSGDESWYDQQRSERNRRDAYVRSQADAGVSELEAKRSWDRQMMIENTRGSARPMDVQGEELDRLIGD